MKTQDVKLYAAQQLHRLQALPDNQRRAELAKLRRGISHAPGELPELWGSFLLEMPESFQGRSAPSAAEWAVYLTLYAVHQQGNDRPMNCPGNTLGRSHHAGNHARHIQLFPAYAGVIPASASTPSPTSTFPRIRGGNPKRRMTSWGGLLFSPHTRGLPKDPSQGFA